MVRLLSSLIASLLLTSASSVVSQGICNGSWSCSTSQGGLLPGDHIYDVHSQATAQYLQNGDVLIDQFGIPQWFSRTRGVAANRFRVSNDGRLELATVSGTINNHVRYLSNNAPQTVLGDYFMAFYGANTIGIYTSSFALIWRQELNRANSLFGLERLFRDGEASFKNDAISIYLPDSGYNPLYNFTFFKTDYDINFNPIQTPIIRPSAFQSFSSDPNYNDLTHHATTEIMLLTSFYAGNAPNNTVHLIKITNGTSLAVREPDVVRSIRAAFTHVTGKPKVINLSMSFGCDWPQTIRCAMQWAYRAGIVVVAAAGNENRNCRSRLQYAFVVGGAYAARYDTNNNASTLGISNYGAMVDGWTLGSVQDPVHSGTSYATAIVSGAAAQAMFNLPTLRNNPAAVFSYLKHHAIFGINPADLKVVYSTHSNNRLIRASVKTFIPATNWTATTEFCTNFTGAGLPTRNPTATNWNTLVARAYTSNRNGSLVHDSSYDVNARVWETPVTP